MNAVFFVLIIVLSAVSGAGLLLLFLYLRLRNKLNETFLSRQLDGGEIEAETSSLVDSKLDNLVSAIQEQIPMSAMFLTGALETKLRNLAKGQLMQSFPEMKERLLKRLLDKTQAFKKTLVFEILGAFVVIVIVATVFALLVLYGAPDGYCKDR